MSTENAGTHSANVMPGTAHFWDVLTRTLSVVSLVFLFVFVMSWLIYNCWINSQRHKWHNNPMILRLFRRTEWLDDVKDDPEIKKENDGESAPVPKFKPQRVIVMQLETDVCHNPVTRAQMIREMKEKVKEPFNYNFLISPNGYTYEAHGWGAMSPRHTDLNAITVAILGSLADGPNYFQLLQLKALLEDSVLVGVLDPYYTIVGKVDKEGDTPHQLFEALRKMPEFDVKLSDQY